MINYTVETTGTMHCVYEKPTGHVIKKFANLITHPLSEKHCIMGLSEAKKLATKLNSGTGFDGNTPAFFLTPVKFPAPEADDDE